MFYLIETALMYYGYYFIFMSLLTGGMFLLFLTVWYDKLDGKSHQDILDLEETMTVISLCEFKRRKEDSA
jgi:hypothetical protein